LLLADRSPKLASLAFCVVRLPPLVRLGPVGSLVVKLGAKLRQPEPDPTFDGARRHGEPNRDLPVSQALEERELNDLPLCARQPRQQPLKLLGLGGRNGENCEQTDRVGRVRLLRRRPSAERRLRGT
jgi:hypothetical protein